MREESPVFREETLENRQNDEMCCATRLLKTRDFEREPSSKGGMDRCSRTTDIRFSRWREYQLPVVNCPSIIPCGGAAREVQFQASFPDLRTMRKKTTTRLEAKTGATDSDQRESSVRARTNMISQETLSLARKRVVDEKWSRRSSGLYRQSRGLPQNRVENPGTAR